MVLVPQGQSCAPRWDNKIETVPYLGKKGRHVPSVPKRAAEVKDYEDLKKENLRGRPDRARSGCCNPPLATDWPPRTFLYQVRKQTSAVYESEIVSARAEIKDR